MEKWKVMKRNMRRDTPVKPVYQCLGFGDLRGRCENVSGTNWSDRWCPACDEKRRANISKQMEDISEKFGHIPVSSKTVAV